VPLDSDCGHGARALASLFESESAAAPTVAAAGCPRRCPHWQEAALSALNSAAQCQYGGDLDNGARRRDSDAQLQKGPDLGGQIRPIMIISGQLERDEERPGKRVPAARGPADGSSPQRPIDTAAMSSLSAVAALRAPDSAAPLRRADTVGVDGAGWHLHRYIVCVKGANARMHVRRTVRVICVSVPPGVLRRGPIKVRVGFRAGTLT
jgi:hypothetical protein